MQSSTSPPVVDYVDALAPAAAGTDDTLSGNEVDMIDAFGADFILFTGTITATAVTTFKLQQSDDDSTYADVTNATVSIAVADDDAMAVIRIMRPKFTMRYLRCQVVRATANAVINMGAAVVYQNSGAVTIGSQGDTTLVAAGVVNV